MPGAALEPCLHAHCRWALKTRSAALYGLSSIPLAQNLPRIPRSGILKLYLRIDKQFYSPVV